MNDSPKAIQFSLVIPTYNEKENIHILIPKLIQILKPIVKFEIIVVDDDSPDKTWHAVEEMSQAYPEVRLIRRYNEKDLSSAIITGFQAAEGEWLGAMDADLQHDENLLPQMLLEMKSANIVIASRYLKESSMNNWPKSRKALSRAGKKIADLILNIHLTDPLSGFFYSER